MSGIIVIEEVPISSSIAVISQKFIGQLTRGQGVLAWNEGVTALPPKTNLLADFSETHGGDIFGTDAIVQTAKKISKEGGLLKILVPNHSFRTILSAVLPDVELHYRRDTALASDWSQRAAGGIVVREKPESCPGG